MSVFSSSNLLEIEAIKQPAFALPAREVADLRSSSKSHEPIDYQTLLDGFLGTADFVVPLLEEFQANAMNRVDELTQRVEAGDVNQVAEAASAIKANADIVAAHTLRALAAALEQFCALGDRKNQLRLAKCLRLETNRCLEQIPLIVATASTAAWCA